MSIWENWALADTEVLAGGGAAAAASSRAGRQFWLQSGRHRASAACHAAAGAGSCGAIPEQRHISEQAVRRQLAENRRGPAQHLDRHAMAPDLRRTMDYALIGRRTPMSHGRSRNTCSVPCWRMMAARRGCCWLPWECPSLRPCGSAASCPGSLSFLLSRGCRPACRGRAVPAINIAAT